MENLKMVKTKLNKRAFKIIRNIELIYFIPYKFIKTYISFLKDNLKEEKEKELFRYLNNNWFNQDYRYYNYWNLLIHHL